MPQGKYFRIGYGIIIVLLILYLATKVNFLIEPLVTVMKVLFLPFILAGVFYYLLRPIVDFLQKHKVPRGLAILAVFLVIFGILTLIVMTVGPMLQAQLNNLINNIPQIASLVQDQVNNLQENEWIKQYLEHNNINVTTKISQFANDIIANTGNVFNSIVGFFSSFVVLLSTVPFILYYLLKEGHKVPNFILKLIPDQHDEEGIVILREMDSSLSAYIQGKIVVSFCVGLLIYIGYTIIGVEYSLILAIAAMCMNVIPFIGLFIGIIPSLVVAFIDSPSMLIKVIIVVLIAQQIESNFLSPQIMGKKLDIHPLTIILLLIAVGSLSGLLGMFLAIPTYAVIKVIVSHFYRFYVLRSKLMKQAK